MRTAQEGRATEGKTGDRLTNDDRVVVSDEHLAVDVDELRDEAPLQLGVSPQTGEGDVVHPLVVHWETEKGEVRLENRHFLLFHLIYQDIVIVLHLLSFFNWEMMEYSPLIIVLSKDKINNIAQVHSEIDHECDATSCLLFHFPSSFYFKYRH